VDCFPSQAGGGGGGACISSGADIVCNSNNFDATQVDAENFAAGTAFNVNAGTAVNINSVGSTDLSSTGGIEADDNSASAGIQFNETGAATSGVDVHAGGWYENSLGGLSYSDNSSGGIAIDEAYGGGLVSIAADNLKLYSLTSADAQLNGSEICTFATGCGGSGDFSGMTQYGLPVAATASTGTSSVQPSSWTSGHTFIPAWLSLGSALAPTAIDLGTYIGANITASLPLVATPSTLGTALSCPTCGSSTGGTAVTVNGGGALASLNINATAPVADASYLALLPKISGGSVIIEAPYGTGAAKGVLQGDASTLSISSGVISCATATSSQLGCVKPDGTVITDTAGAITVPAATSSALGVVKPDGTIITDSSGAITVAKASSSAFGVVEVDNTTITATGGVISAVGGSGATYQTLTYPNDSTGTHNGRMACWVSGGSHGVNTIQDCPTSYGVANGGTNNPAPMVGIVVSGGGTTGNAVVAVSGSGIQWICDEAVVPSATGSSWLQLSSSVAGECYQPNTGDLTPNENPESNTIDAYATAGNSGAGTPATVTLVWNGWYVPTAAGYNYIVLGANGSPSQGASHWFQQPSSSATEYDLGCWPVCGIAIPQYTGDTAHYTHFGYSANGVSGNDTLLDARTYRRTSTDSAQFEMNTQMWQPPTTGGTWNGSLAIDISNWTNIIAATLAGNTTVTLTYENPGHYQTWDITQAASGGPYAPTWPADFVNAPTMTTVAGASTLFETYWDGTHHLCTWGCAGSGGGIADIQVTVGTTTVSANSCTGASTATMTGLATTSAIFYNPASDISAVTGWSPAGTTLYFVAWPTANTLNYKVCNASASNITPGSSTTWNFGAR